VSYLPSLFVVLRGLQLAEHWYLGFYAEATVSIVQEAG
jgi:hypothetical protein